MASHPSRAGRVVAAVVVGLMALLQPRPLTAQTAAEFFAGQTVDDVWIHINSRDWRLLRGRPLDSTFYPCDLQWRTVKVSNAGCRMRGTGSRSATKPALDIHFDHYVSGQRFLGLSQLVLDNLWQDPSMLQERLTMWLFQRMGVAAPREAHIRLFAGSAREFMGVYAAVEAVTPEFLERAWNAPAAYLYEYRWIDSYHFEDLGDALEPYAARFAARTHEVESMFALYSPVREMVATFNAGSMEQIGAAFDLDAFSRQLAVENYVSDWDGLLGYAGLNNFYVVRQPGSPVRFVPWDKDFEFLDVTLPPWHNVEYNVLALKVWNDPFWVRQYLRALLVQADSGAEILGELEREYAQIAPLAAADALKPGTTEEFEAAVEQLRSFLQQRPVIVRRHVLGLAPELAP